MAAIIAQLTRYGPGRQIFPSQNIFYFRAQRERNNRVTYSTNKCLYDLPPFDQHFDPLVHNKYLSRWLPTPHNLTVMSKKLFQESKTIRTTSQERRKITKP